MSKATDLSLIKILFSNFAGRLHFAHTSLDRIRLYESLSPAGMLSLKTIGFCHSHLNHLCKLIDYLISGHSVPDSLTTDTFDSEQLMSEIASAFNKTVPDSLSVSAGFCSRLQYPHSVQVNKSKFETIILSLLYCCLKSADNSGDKKTRLTLSVSTTKKNIVFHIRTNNSTKDADSLERMFNASEFHTLDIYSTDAVLALSVEIASKYVRESEGTLTFKTLKSGVRYDISLPKRSSGTLPAFCSPMQYSPSLDDFEETFAEFSLRSLERPVLPENIEL